VQFDPDALIASMQRLMSYKPKQMYLTHFGAIEPTTKHVEQLIQAVRDIKQMALDAIDLTENRVTKLQQQLEAHVLEKLAEMQCDQSAEFQLDVMRNDIELNAQGMDVWLSRLAKQA